MLRRLTVQQGQIFSSRFITAHSSIYDVIQTTLTCLPCDLIDSYVT